MSAALEFSEHPLKAFAGGIRRTRVVKPLVFARPLLLVRRRLKNGRNHCACVWFGWLACVNCLRSEFHDVLLLSDPSAAAFEVADDEWELCALCVVDRL